MVKHAALRLFAWAIPESDDDRDWVGQRIQFWGRKTDVLTSPITAVGRPRIDEVIDYVSQARAGEISEHASAQLKASLPKIASAG